MDWTQALTIIFSTVGFVLVLFIYLMSRMDNKFEQLLNRMDSNQKENNAKFEAMNGRFNGLENRLTALESEVKNTNQRIDNTSQRITDLKTDINQRLSNIENCVMPRKVYRFEDSHKPDHEEPKEN